jgi:hypothetical protein
VSKPAEARQELHASGSIAAHPSYTPQGPHGASEGVDGGRVYASIAGALAVVSTKSAGAVAAVPRPLASTWTSARSRGSQRTRNSALGGGTDTRPGRERRRHRRGVHLEIREGGFGRDAVLRVPAEEQPADGVGDPGVGVHEGAVEPERGVADVRRRQLQDAVHEDARLAGFHVPLHREVVPPVDLESVSVENALFVGQSVRFVLKH